MSCTTALLLLYDLQPTERQPHLMSLDAAATAAAVNNLATVVAVVSLRGRFPDNPFFVVVLPAAAAVNKHVC